MKKPLLSSKGRFIFWLSIVLILLVVSLVGPHFIKHDPYEMDLDNVRSAPSSEYIFGTDKIGRCTFCRLVT